MTQAPRAFRIFVSSTFHDLKEERNALQEKVFPRLRELCMQHGARFQAIDLRWGVSEQASLDQQAVNICLGEIARCQKTTPRPNFIVLLGDRYGWRPLPSEIPADEFEEIERRVSEDADRALLTTWYKRDDNAVPPEYCLQPRTGEFEDYGVWEEQVERRLHKILAEATEGTDLTPEERLKYVASATHQEIAHGALQVEGAPDHVFCFFRRIKDLPLDATARGFLDLNEAGSADRQARQQLDNLKEQLRRLLPGNVHEYAAEWAGRGASTDHIEQLCDDVYKCLSQVILEEVGGFMLEEVGPPEETDPLEMEIVEHQEFGIHRARFFVGRGEILETIRNYVAGSDPHPLAVWGQSGSGKSALMAKAIQQAVEMHPESELVFRFIGATPESSNGRALLESLCRQVSHRYGADESTIPMDYRELVAELPECLALATEQKPLILFLDAVDQLSDADNARNLAWLPKDLPDHVRLVVSTLPGECRSVLQAKLPSDNLVELKPMSPERGSELLYLWLEDADRTLLAHQREEVLGKFNEEGNGLPLYLKLAFEEARRWKSYTDPQETLLGPDVPGVIRDLFARLSAEGNHGEMLVSRSLGYLAAAKNGLTEDELLDVLCRDVDLYAWFLESLYHTPPDLLKCVQEHLEDAPSSRPEEERDKPIDEQAAEEWLKDLGRDRNRLLDFLSTVLTKADGLRLPVVLWSRLYFDLEPYLALRSGDGTALLSFYHRQLGEVTGEEYLSGEDTPKRHQSLARYFEVQPLYTERDDQVIPNLRKLSEVPYQQTHGELWDGMEQTLCDLHFIEAKCAAGMTYDLIGDYDAALDALPEAQEERQTETEHKERVEKYTEGLIALARGEIDSLDIIPSVEPWGDARFRKETERIINNPTPLDRIRAFSQFVNSESHSLVKFGSHPRFCVQQAYNSANSGPVAKAAGIIVNGEPDHILVLRHPSQRLYSDPHPALLRSLEGHTEDITSVSVTPDGRRALSGGWENTLRLWNLESGECLGTLEGHQYWVACVSVTPDGKRAVSASWDETLRVWDLESRECLRTLEGHKERALCASITPDGKRAVSASDDETLRVWDLESGECLRTLEGHTSWVRSVSVTPDARIAVSGSEDKVLRVWDLRTGECLAILEGHKGGIESVSVTPDGKRAVSGSDDRTLRVWNLESGECLRTLEGHAGAIESVSLTPDGKRAMSGSRDDTLRLWDLESGECLRTLKGHSVVGGPVTVTPCARGAISGGDDTLRVWNLESGECLETPPGHTGVVGSVRFTSNGRSAVSAGNDNTVRVWDLENGEGQDAFTGHKRDVTSVCITPDDKRAVSASNDKTLRVWDLENGKCLRTLEAHTDYVNTVTVTPDGRRAVSGSWDCTLRVWDLENGLSLRVLSGHGNIVTTVTVTPDGKRALSGSADGTLRLWDLERGECLARLWGDTDQYTSVGVTPDGRRAVSGSSDGTIQVWDLKSGECLRSLKAHSYDVTSVKITPDGKRALSGSWDRTLRLWDLQTGERVAVWQGRRGVASASQIRANGDVACGTNAGEVVLLRFHGSRIKPPIVSSSRIWLYGERGKNGRWEDTITTVCQWCGQRFPLEDEILNVIGGMVRSADLSPDQSPCLELPAEAWEEQRLLSECPHCHRALRFNPFIVDDGEKLFEREVSVEVEDFRTRGTKLMESGKLEEALACFNEALKLQPSDLRLLDSRAGALLKLGRQQEALDTLEDILDRQLASGESLGNILAAKAHTLLGLKRYEEASTYYQKALELAPADHNTWFGQGSALFALRRFEEALASFSRSSDLKDEERTSQRIGYCLAALKRYPEAEGEFAALASQGAPDPQAFYGLGLVKVMMGKKEEARPHIERFIEIAGPEHQDLLPAARKILEAL